MRYERLVALSIYYIFSIISGFVSHLIVFRCEMVMTDNYDKTVKHI